MGVDYSCVSGLGIEITPEIIQNLIDSEVINEEAWDYDKYECLDDIGILYDVAGNSYSGEDILFWLIPGDTLNEVNANVSKFIKDLNKIGVIITTEDVILIQELHIS